MIRQYQALHEPDTIRKLLEFSEGEMYMAHAILIHEKQDDVGVAVKDLKRGEEVGVVTLEGDFVATIKMSDDVPLGHKVAMRALVEGTHVTEYGRTIGSAISAVAPGGHVHVHNIKTLRWSK